MLRSSIKFLDFAFKHSGSSYSPNFVCRRSFLRNIKCTSVINLSKFSTQTSSEPESSEIIRIYEGPLAARLKTVKILSLCTSIIGLTVFPITIEKITTNPDRAGIYITFLSLVSFLSFGTPIMLQVMSVKYILFIDYNPSKDLYTLYRYSLFLKLVSVDFKASDVARVNKPLVTVTIRNKGYLLDPANFNDLEHYKRMVDFNHKPEIRLESQIKSDNTEQELKRPEIPEFDYQTPKREKQPRDEELGVPINLRKKKR